MAFALLYATLLAALPADAPPPAEDLSLAYRRARDQAGRSSAEQVKLALWCEAHGLTRERLTHLAQAVLSDPANATARGLMGLVAYDGRFIRPEAVAERSKADPILAEYDQRRARAPYTADGQWAMGVWAEARRLKDQARAHFTAVTRLDPSREVAWRRLGYRKQGGRWVTEAQLASERAEADAQKQADRNWKPLLDRYRAMLDQPSKRDEAEAALLAITDPRAVPSIVGAFVAGGRPDPLRAVQLLGRVDSPPASRALASLAVSSPSPEARRAAVETLRHRDPREFVWLWIGLIRDPIRFQVEPVGGPGSPGALVVEGRKANLRRVYAPPAMPEVPILPGSRLGHDANGLPVVTQRVGVEVAATIEWVPYYDYDNPPLAAALTQAIHGGNLRDAIAHQGGGQPTLKIAGYLPYLVTADGAKPISFEEANRLNLGRAEAMQGFLQRGEVGNAPNFFRVKELQVPIGAMRLEAQESAAASRRQLADDAASIEGANEGVRRSNERVLGALRTVTGKDFGDDSTAWSQWCADRSGYALATQTQEKPTVVEVVPSGITPTTLPQVVDDVVIAFRHACFGAGTTVRTSEGERAIETIRAGDLVLSQDTRSGALTYRPVVASFHNPPNATLRVRIWRDVIVVTGIHRFWKAGKGWVMARELKPGDSVRTLGGVARVESVEDDQAQPVFNLEVAQGHSFLVGKIGALVHDNSLVEPETNPFDAQAEDVAREGR